MSVRQAIRSAFSLEEGSASPEEIRQSILSGAHVKGTNLCILVLAILIASIGLNMNSTAVIIGAMLISPLMGGIMAVGYGFALGDLRLSRRAFIGLLFQVIVCIVASTLYFSLSPISTAHSELLARTMPTVWDVLIAVCGGLAGIIGVTRKEKTNVIPGVAIATALMPPLCTAGYGLATRSLSFFLWAMYLFFINGFFICVSTFVVVRLMRLPRQEFENARARRKMRITLTVVAIITVLPSIYLAYRIVGDSLTESSVQKYIASEFSFDDTQVVRSSADTKAKEIRVALLGKRLSEERIQELRSALPGYGLEGMTLKVTQTELEQGMTQEDIQAIIEKELDQNSQENAALSQKQELENLKAELVGAKAKLLDYQAFDFDMQAITRELQALYPQVQSCSMGRHRIWSETTQQVENRVMATLDLPAPMSAEEKTRVETWLAARAGVQAVTVYENIAPAGE